MAGIVAFFDHFYLDRHFYKNGRGETVLLPFGRNRRGYLLPIDKEADVKRAMRLQFFASCIAAVPLAVLGLRMVALGYVGSWSGLLAMVLWFALFACMLIYARFNLFRGLRRADDASATGMSSEAPKDRERR
jgi:hypothetical protein